MIIFVNERNEIKDVDVTRDETLKAYEITGDNPFANWPVDKICCYKVGLTPETVTEVIGTEEYTYTDLEGNEVTETRDVTETKETGKYLISMMTPYIDSRIIDPIVWLLGQIKLNSADILTTQDALCEVSMDAEERFTVSDERMLEIETALCDLSMVLLSE